MTHLLDTDHLSILQRPTGREYPILVANINMHPIGDIGASIVSFHEQALGAHSLINQSKDAAELVRHYELLNKLLEGYSSFSVLPFDTLAAGLLDQFKAQKIRIGRMDLRIAAIARSRNLVLVTRNTSDFGQVPGLRLEDWTK